MFLPPEWQRVGNRSGEELSMDDLALMRKVLESSDAIRRFDEGRRPRTGKLTFGTVDMLMVMLYTEINKTTYGGAIAQLRDFGGEERLSRMGMPFEKGIRRCPSKATMSNFVNRIWPRLSEELIAEMSRAIVEHLPVGSLLWTCDSTPLEASRYSPSCAYNPHYEVRMDKCHIIMVNGYPVMFTHTGGNAGDNPEMKAMLSSMDGLAPSMSVAFATDGAYHNFESYALVYRKTGKVMATNQGVGAVFHPEASWRMVLGRYQRMWRNRDYVLPRDTNPDGILRYLMSHGCTELVGKFLHNLDLMRGRGIKDAWSKARHVCETVHFNAKRWMDFDVRGLRREGRKQRISLRFFFCQLLSTLFRPVYG